MIQELRKTQGPLFKGVTLQKGKSDLVAIPSEPVFTNAPKWLDPSENDDRILCTVINLIRQHPKCVVALVTNDTNMRNKADMARIDCLETP